MVVTLECLRCGKEFEAVRVDAVWCPDCRVERKKARLKRYDLARSKAGNCIDCGKAIGDRSSRCITCGNKAKGWRYRGEGNAMWKGGRTETTDGYMAIRVNPTNEKGKPYELEHRVVWEKANGAIPKGWVVHHLNGTKNDNRIENLVAMPRKDHNPLTITEPYKKRIRELEYTIGILLEEMKLFVRI